MKLSTAIDQFLTELKVTHSKDTWSGYESHLKRLTATAQVDSILRFTTDLVQRALETASGEGKKMATLHVKRAACNSFGRWGVRKGLWATNPVELVSAIRRPKHLPRPFTTDEAARLMALPLPPDEWLLMRLFFLTGLRVTPTAHVKVGDISFAPPKIRAWVKGAKTQVIELHPDLIEPLQAYVTAHTSGKAHAFLFPNRAGGPTHRREIEKATQRWGRAAGVLNCTPHRFRHSFATKLYEHTRDIALVKEAMGHADIGSTMIYTKITSERLATGIAGVKF